MTNTLTSFLHCFQIQIVAVGYQRSWPWESIVVVGFGLIGLMVVAIPTIGLTVRIIVLFQKEHTVFTTRLSTIITLFSDFSYYLVRYRLLQAHCGRNHGHWYDLQEYLWGKLSPFPPLSLHHCPTNNQTLRITVWHDLLHQRLGHPIRVYRPDHAPRQSYIRHLFDRGRGVRYVGKTIPQMDEGQLGSCSLNVVDVSMFEYVNAENDF